jgi:hypothetical protein
MSEWLELARRCEQATGADREIDVLIGMAIDWKTDATRPLREVVSIYGGTAEFVARCIGSTVSIYSHDEHMPRWTASLDAITALIEREMPKCDWQLCKGGECTLIYGGGIYEPLSVEAKAATPALALAACFCRAMAEMR